MLERSLAEGLKSAPPACPGHMIKPLKGRPFNIIQHCNLGG